MFDDGSFECHNFWIADQDGTYQVGAESEVISNLRDVIVSRMDKGWKHLVCTDLVYDGVQVLEIQWD